MTPAVLYGCRADFANTWIVDGTPNRLGLDEPPAG
jgi:hypothetical protein